MHKATNRRLISSLKAVKMKNKYIQKRLDSLMKIKIRKSIKVEVLSKIKS